MAYRCTILDFSQRLQEGAGADEDEDDAHDPHEDFGGEDLAELGGEGGNFLREGQKIRWTGA